MNRRDSIGNSFYFKLNGNPVFMKGANYIPSDIFLQSKTKEEYVKQIQTYKKANMNMLRIWGGGTYGEDDFYNACDENGILVWQDFMFACAMYPVDTAFMENVRLEVEQQVKRIRSHPSLALWCGNNENSEGWYNWGWQKKFNYSQKDSLEIWNNYQKLFQQIIPGCLEKLDQRPYWESSPSMGWGRKESLRSGDSHYWGVWWGMEPFSVYRNKVGRFTSEYGFQSLPSLNTLKRICPSSELNVNSESMRAHQKHKTGFETIQTYMERDYKIPREFSDYVYVSQLLQRDGMKTAIEAHRTYKPYCMGTLFWQLNDCWPGVSWSAIDYFNHPKALYYSLSKLYKTQLLSVNATSNAFEIKCISDSTQNYESTLSVKILNFKSEILWQKNVHVSLSNDKVFSLFLNKNELPVFDTTGSYMKVELGNPGKLFASTYYFFAKAKDLKLPKTTVNIVKRNATSFEISSEFFAKDVYIMDENLNLILNDNFFDLEAGEKKKVSILELKDKRQQVKLKAVTLNNL